MEMTEPLSSAIDRHQRAVVELSEVLDRYREGGSSLAEEAEPGPRLDRASQEYELSSLAVTGLIVDQLVVNPEGDGDVVQLDDDATTRLTDLIAIDAKIAEQAALLAEIRVPQGSEDGLQTRPLTRQERADLGPALAAAVKPVFEELRQGEQQAVQHVRNWASRAACWAWTFRPNKVQHHAKQILHRAGKDIVGTIDKSVPLHEVLAPIRDLVGAVDGWPRDVLNHLTSGIQHLQRLLARAWRQVLLKISALVGQHVTMTGQTIGRLLSPSAIKRGAEGLVGRFLRRTLRVQEPTMEAEKLVRHHPGRSCDAMRACKKVDRHHLRRRRAVPWLNRALPACRMLHVGGIAFEAVAAAVLLIYSVWLVHDHLDSPVLAQARLPKNPGLLTEIQIALGQVAHP